LFQIKGKKNVRVKQVRTILSLYKG